MKSDVKIKIIQGGDLVGRLKQLEEFKKNHRVISTTKGGAVIIVKWSEGQVNFDDVEVVSDGDVPW